MNYGTFSFPRSVISYDRRKALDAQIPRFLAELRMTKRFEKQFIWCSLQILSFSKHLSHFNVNLDISELTYSSFLLFTLWWFQKSSLRLKKLIRVMFLFFSLTCKSCWLLPEGSYRMWIGNEYITWIKKNS